MSKRVNVNFSDDAYAALEYLAAQKGTSMSEVLMDAISLDQYLTKAEKEENARILIERPGGKLQEIVRF